VTVRAQRRLAYGLLMFVALTAAWFAGSAAASAERSKERAQELAEAQYADCVQHNVVQADARRATLAVINAALDSRELNAEQLAVLDRIEATTIENYPFRDCSEEGIDAYFADPPADPALEETP
jgi:hypothetical protein